MTPNFLQPNQPVNILTPVDHIKRCFLLSWYTFFQWLECDQLNDLAFCYPCKNFGSGEALKDNFVSLGYKNWKNHVNEKKLFSELKIWPDFKMKMNFDKAQKTFFKRKCEFDFLRNIQVVSVVSVFSDFKC